MPPLSSQLKLKPKVARPLNTVSGGRYPPPAPVHAVSIIARMPAAARTMDRRYNRGVPVFTVSSEAVRREGPGGRAKVHDVGDFPDVQGLMSSRTGGWAGYAAQSLSRGGS